MDSDALADLIKQAQQGDVVAYRSIYRHFAPRIFGSALISVEKPPMSKRLTKVAFLRIWESLADVGVKLDTWIMSMVHDSFLEQFRGRGALRSKSISDEQIASVLDSVFTASPETELAFPSPVLWREIQAHIETEDIAPIHRQKPKHGLRLWHVGALLMLLIAARAGYMILVEPTLLGVPNQVNTPTGNVLPKPGGPAESVALTVEDVTQEPEVLSAGINPQVLELQSQYSELKTELLANTEISGDEYDEDIQTIMADDMDIVEKSISEIVGAMGDDPENEVLEEMLVSSCKKQIKLLKSFYC